MPAWVVPAAVAAAGFLGGERANRTNQREAMRNRAFQERMRNTQWQAAVSDMEAAGINPALAYARGPNAAPGGSATAPAHDTVSSALGAAQQRKTLQLLDSQVEKTRAEASGAKAEALLKSDRAEYLTRRGNLILPDGRTVRGVPKLYDLLDAEVASARHGASNLEAQAARTRELTRIAGPMADLSDQMGTLLPILSMFLNPASGLTRSLIGRGARRLPKRNPFARTRSTDPRRRRR